MKLTAGMLRKIIAEEVSRVVSEEQTDIQLPGGEWIRLILGVPSSELFRADAKIAEARKGATKPRRGRR